MGSKALVQTENPLPTTAFFASLFSHSLTEDRCVMAASGPRDDYNLHRYIEEASMAVYKSPQASGAGCSLRELRDFSPLFCLLHSYNGNDLEQLVSLSSVLQLAFQFGLGVKGSSIV